MMFAYGWNEDQYKEWSKKKRALDKAQNFNLGDKETIDEELNIDAPSSHPANYYKQASKVGYWDEERITNDHTYIDPEDKYEE